MQLHGSSQGACASTHATYVVCQEPETFEIRLRECGTLMVGPCVLSLCHFYLRPCVCLLLCLPAPGGILRGLSAPATRSRRSLSAMAVAAPAAAQQTKDFVKQAHGFTLVQQQFVREYDSHVLMYKHDKTGMGVSDKVWGHQAVLVEEVE